jgi:hypothetical protein
MIIIAEDPAEYLFDVVSVTVPRIPPEHNPIGNDGSFEELCFLTAARERGYVTWVPIGHSQKADVAIWRRPHRPITVQVKRGQFRKGGWRCHVGATRGGREKKMRRANNKPLDELRKYEVGDFDVLALYVPPANAFRFWPLHSIAGQRCVSLSDLSTLNNWHVIEDAIKHNL